MADSTLVSRLLDLWSDSWPPDTGLSSEGHAGDALVSTMESLQYGFPQTDWNDNPAFEERHTWNTCILILRVARSVRAGPGLAASILIS